jgi:hypothetical protein
MIQHWEFLGKMLCLKYLIGKYVVLGIKKHGLRHFDEKW